MNKYTLLLRSLVYFLGIFAFPLIANGQTQSYDILIRNAIVFDGKGGDSLLTDVGIRGEHIVFVGKATGKAEAKRTIDAQGLYLAPGFIDPHTHYSPQLSSESTYNRAVHRALAQGVTTVFEGNDGGGSIPIGETLAQWESKGIGPNAALFVGHNTIRRKVLGSGNVQPSAAELEEMKSLVEQAMEEGAFGLSTGLFYNPGNFAKTEEVIELAKVAAKYGGIYDTHQRDEGSQNIGVLNSSREVLEIAEKANIHVHFSHLKVAGPQAWGKSTELIKMVEDAHLKGLRVTANQYPYVASRTGLSSALVPAWALDGGVAHMRRRFRQPELRDSILKGIHQSIQARTADPSKLVLSSNDEELNGKSLADLAHAWGITAEEAVIKICLTSSPAVHSFMMIEEDIENFMKQPWVMTGSDGGGGHPRAFGSFARVIEEYVHNRNVMTMAEAIHKATYLTAQTLQVKNRGLIAEGYFADIVLFDPQKIKAESNYLDGEQLATGVQYVLVNGNLAIDAGQLQEGLHGKALRLNASQSQALADQVLIRRTEFGVPHILADNMEAAGYAMGYLQLEDYGIRVVNGLVRVRGEWAKFNELKGRALNNQLEADASEKLRHKRARETFSRLNPQTQDLLSGFAKGINTYIEKHPEEFPKWIEPNFTAIDVHARSIGTFKNESVRKFLDALKESRDTRGELLSALYPLEETHPETGSNVWALAPSRTKSGHAILMRNPHLNWNAGYYEAQMIVPGQLNFYGDFRVGEPLGIVGGFNHNLGWSTTNNYTDNEEIYAFKRDKSNANHYILDGKSLPIEEKVIEVSYKKGQSVEKALRTKLFTEFGPVIHQTDDFLYIIKAANDGEYRTNEQFLRMMAAENLEEWKDAMRMQARVTSNFTYADADGNILYVWNGSIPDISHPSGMDTAAIHVDSRAQIWSNLIPWDNLPQVLNPQGGYVRNENDPFHFTNLNHVFDEKDFPDNFPKAALRLRSQLSLQLIGGEDKLSLEEVVERKHDMTALLASRVKSDLIQAVRGEKPDGKMRQAIHLVEKWDNTVSADSRGSVLFKTWWDRYVHLAADGKRVESTPESAGYSAPAEALFVHPWSPQAPTTTPSGLASKNLAVDAFTWAIQECEKRYGGWDLSWGEVHRAVIGEQDYPIGGASGDMGAFRVLWFGKHKEDAQKVQVTGGDCWVFAVEFGPTPRAYTVLSYGQSIKEDSPYYADQLRMFSENQMKTVSFSLEDIIQNTIRSYRPGKEE